MENQSGFMIFRIFLILSSFEATCQASIPAVKSAENFLFRYFDLHPNLKSLPLGVQHMISAQLKDDYLVPFVLEEPLAQYSAEDSEFDTQVAELEFCSDDSHLAIITNKHCRIGALTLHGAARNQSLTTFESHLPLDVWVKVRLNADFTRMLVARDTEEDATLSEIQLTNYKATGEEQLPGSIKKLFKDETLYSGSRYTRPRNRIASYSADLIPAAAIYYTPSDDIVLATTYKQVFFLSRDGSVKKVVDALNHFNPRETVPRMFDGIGMEDIGESHAILHPSSPMVAFQAGADLTLVNTETGEYKTVLAHTANGPFLEAIAPNGRWVMLFSKNMLHVIDTEKHTKRNLKFPYRAAAMQFILDGIFFLIHQFDGQKSWIYDTVSLSLIGCIDHRYDLKPDLTDKPKHGYYFVSSSSRSGKYLALFIELPQYQKKPLKTLRIWKTNPHWSKLTNLYQGHITIEQVLLIIFLRTLASQKKSLGTVAEEAGIPRNILETYLQDIRNTFKVDQQALRSYIRYVVLREPKLKAH